jgi:hypothetical protein
VQRGAHNDVNLIAAGSLVAVLNVAQKHGVEVPFFFGGDGGTFMVPTEMLDDVMLALKLHGSNAERSFGLSMHLGAIPLANIRMAGSNIRLAKTKLGTGLSKAVVLGDGLLWAEQQVKGHSATTATAPATEEMPDLMGLECRWDRIPPPKPRYEVVCYLIEAVRPDEQLHIYREVLRQIDHIFGATELHNPISSKRLKLLFSTKKLRKEMKARFGKWRWGYYANAMARTAAAIFAIKSKAQLGSFDAASYLNEIITNADTLTIDGRINTIICATPEHTQRFLEYLDKQEAAGLLCYGHHSNRESIMTCYIQAREKDHVHFVDGSDGGYTAAAKELKRKKTANHPPKQEP